MCFVAVACSLFVARCSLFTTTFFLLSPSACVLVGNNRQVFRGTNFVHFILRSLERQLL